MDGIADMGGVVGRSATYALARAEPALAERCGGPALASPLACNRLTARSLHAFRRAVEHSKLTDCLGGGELVSAEPWESGAFAMAVTIHAQELSDRPTDKDREH